MEVDNCIQLSRFSLTWALYSAKMIEVRSLGGH